MRGARRLTIACLAAGLMLGSTSASAQDAATTTNTPAAQAVGPRELENFSLQGNVTRAAEEPAQRPSPAPLASTRDDQPASAATTVRQPRERTASTEPAASSPRSTPSPQREPARETATAATQPTATPSDGLLTHPTSTPIPASATTFAPPPLASTGTLAPERGFSLLPWLLAALAAVAAGLFLFWRNRSRPALAGGPQADFFQAPEAKPVRWLTPEELEPKPMPRPAPSPTPAPPRAETPAPPPVGVVSTSLRPWVEISMQPLRCTVTDANVTFEFELELFNSGSAPARDIFVEAVVVNAGENQDQDLATFFARLPGPGQRIEIIPPLNRTAFVTQVVIAREHIRSFDLGGREVFVPLLAFNAFYRRGSGEAQSSVAYLVGPATKGDKLAPFRLDLGARLFEGLAARLLPLGVRK